MFVLWPSVIFTGSLCMHFTHSPLRFFFFIEMKLNTQKMNREKELFIKCTRTATLCLVRPLVSHRSLSLTPSRVPLYFSLNSRSVSFTLVARPRVCVAFVHLYHKLIYQLMSIRHFNYTKEYHIQRLTVQSA